MSMQEGEKLQKVLARAGLGSRRQLETWISNGRVSINGARAVLGARVSAHDTIRVDGRIIATHRAASTRPRVLRYHKPVGEICTRDDPQGRPTVFDRLPVAKSGRWLSIGRLDVTTTGLLLFTNDGELAHRLTHPSSQVEREYLVRVYGEVSDELVKRMRDGVMLEDGEARFHAVIPVGGDGRNAWYRVIVRRGRNREVRRLWESQGLEVSRLSRVRFGPISLRRGLPPARWEELGDEEANALLRAAGLPARKSSQPSRHRHKRTGRR